WEIATRAERLQLAGHAGRVGKLLFADNGRTLVSASDDTTALVWDVTGMRQAVGEQTSNELADLWNTLADANAAKAHLAGWGMTATPRRSVTFLGERLRPVGPADQ